MSKAKAEELGLTWLAEIGAHGVVAPAPDARCRSSLPTRSRRLREAGHHPQPISMVELNEAFAAVGLASTEKLGLDPAIVNVSRGRHRARSSARDVRCPPRAELLALGLAPPRWRPGATALCGGGGQNDALIITVPASEQRRPWRGPDDVPDLVAGARRGEPCAVARLISLVEDGSPQLREVAEQLTPRRKCPHRRADRFAWGGQVDHHLGLGERLSGGRQARRECCGPPPRPSPAGRCWSDRVRMQEHALDTGVFIRSMASRGHLGGLAWATPQALRVLDGAGCGVILVETVGGAVRSRSHHRRPPTPWWCCSRPGWAMASRPPRRESWRSAMSSRSTRRIAMVPTPRLASCGMIGPG